METNITVTTTKKCKFKIHGKQGIANVHIESWVNVIKEVVIDFIACVCAISTEK